MAEARVTLPDGRTAIVRGPDRESILARVDALRNEQPSQTPQQSQAQQPLETQTPTALNPVVAETAGALNRGIAAIPDFFVDAGNAAVNLAGVDARIPRVQDTLEGATGGAFGARNFMEPGLARTVVQEGGEFVPGVAAGLAGGARVAQKTTQELAEEARNQAARVGGQIRTGDISAVRTTVNEAGQATKDTLAKSALKQGFQERTVSRLKASSDSTKSTARRVIDFAERRLKNSKFDRRPSEAVGDVLGNRVKSVLQENRKAGRLLNREANKLTGKTIDVSPAVQSFADDLQAQLGVQVGDDLAASFDGAIIEGTKEAESLIRLMLTRAKKLTGDAKQAHEFKRFIDSKVSFGKKQEGLDAQVERVVKSLRRNIDQTLDTQFPSYKAVNDTFAETRGALDDFQAAVGSKLDLTSPNADSALGTVSRRLLSNAQSRSNLEDAIAQLDAAASKTGVDVSQDLMGLVELVDDLNRVVRPEAQTSLLGDVAKSTATEGRAGAVRRVAGEAVDRAQGINPENAIQSLKRLLSE